MLLSAVGTCILEYTRSNRDFENDENTLEIPIIKGEKTLISLHALEGVLSPKNT